MPRKVQRRKAGKIFFSDDSELRPFMEVWAPPTAVAAGRAIPGILDGIMPGATRCTGCTGCTGCTDCAGCAGCACKG